MNSYCMKNGRNESVLNSFYHDAYIHTEDKKVFMVHKVMVATHSPFLHEYFQSRPGHDVNDVFFQSTHSSTVQAALDLMYNGEVSIETKYIKSFKWFLETLLCVMVEDKTEVMHQRPQKVTNRSMVILMFADTLASSRSTESEPDTFVSWCWSSSSEAVELDLGMNLSDPLSSEH